MTYFISIEELKQNNVINANVDSEYIEPALKEAQAIFLKELIGDALYTVIENKINGNTLTGKYQTLVNDYIKPYLEMRMLSSLVVPISMKIRNAGVIQQFDQGFNSSNVKDVAYLADYYNGRVEFYENRMTEYLKKNVNDIPEYAYSSQNITNPSQTHTAGTIYLGGNRKRSCGANYGGSGGGTATTVDWDNITNRPDFAQVATSGDYEDLDNKPSIPTVNDAVLTIKQGGVNKGTFSANANQNVEIDLEAGGSGSTDWSDIQNKPNFATVATSGDYNDLQNKPSIPAPQVQADWQQNDSTQPDYIKHRPSMPSAQIQSDWNQTNTSEVDYIKNKPTIPVVPTNVSAFNNDAGYTTFDGDYSSLTNKPSIPAAQVQSDWNANSGMGEILNKPSMTAETWTFTLSDNTTVTKTVWLQ